jgi:hypothetical protein
VSTYVIGSGLARRFRHPDTDPGTLAWHPRPLALETSAAAPVVAVHQIQSNRPASTFTFS